MRSATALKLGPLCTLRPASVEMFLAIPSGALNVLPSTHAQHLSQAIHRVIDEGRSLSFHVSVAWVKANLNIEYFTAAAEMFPSFLRCIFLSIRHEWRRSYCYIQLLGK